MISINLANVIAILTNSYCLFLEHSCFRKKTFRVFRGVQPAPMWAKACPFLEHSYFQFKCFAVFRGCNIIDSGISDVPKSHILIFRKKVLQNLGHKMAQNGPKWPKMAQNGPKLHNYFVGCPFFGHSYFENKCFGQIRTCNILAGFSLKSCMQKFMTRNMLTKK